MSHFRSDVFVPLVQPSKPRLQNLLRISTRLSSDSSGNDVNNTGKEDTPKLRSPNSFAIFFQEKRPYLLKDKPGKGGGLILDIW